MTNDLITFSVPVAGKEGRFKATAYSGGVIPNYRGIGDVAIDLNSISFTNPVPVLTDHQNAIDQIAGYAELSVENNELIAVGKLNRVTKAGEIVSDLMLDGHPVQLSVGINAKVRSLSNVPIQINGKALTLAAVFENATVRELSFVPVGADPRTSAHLFNKQEHHMPEITQEMVDSLRAELAEEKARNEALSNKLAELEGKFAAKIRHERETALAEFSLKDEQKEAMLGMTDEQFAASLDLAKSLKKATPEHLFRDMATSGKPPKADTEMPLTASVKAKYSV